MRIDKGGAGPLERTVYPEPNRKAKSCMQYQTIATKYPTQHNNEWTKENHTNKVNVVDIGVLPQHHQAADYYYHRGSYDVNYDSYEDNNYGNYNSYGYNTGNKFEQNGYNRFRKDNYRNKYCKQYYKDNNSVGTMITTTTERATDCYANYNNYGYDDCRYNHYECTHNKASKKLAMG